MSFFSFFFLYIYIYINATLFWLLKFECEIKQLKQGKCYQVSKFNFFNLNFFNLSCKTQLYYKHTPRTCWNFIMNSLAETTTTTLNSIESSRSLSREKLFLYCTFCFVEECKFLHRYWFIFGIGFYGAIKQAIPRISNQTGHHVLPNFKWALVFSILHHELARSTQIFSID